MDENDAIKRLSARITDLEARIAALETAALGSPDPFEAFRFRKMKEEILAELRGEAEK